MSHYLEQNGDDLWLDGPPVYFCFGPQQAGESVLAVISWDSWGRTLDLICATCCFLIIFFSRPHSETLLFLKIKNGWRRVFWHRQHDPVAIRDCHMQVVTAGLLWSELNFAQVQRMFPRSHRETNLKGWSGNVFVFCRRCCRALWLHKKSSVISSFTKTNTSLHIYREIMLILIFCLMKCLLS